MSFQSSTAYFGLKLCPLALNLFCSASPLSLLGLRGISKLLESLGVHFHVTAHDAVRDGRHRLVPVRLLRALHKVLHHQRVRRRLVHPHHLLNSIRVEQQKGSLSCLVVH